MHLTNCFEGVRLITFSILLIVSSHALAETIIQRLLGDTSLQTESLRLITNKMAQQKRLEVPAFALNEDDYQRLLNEIRKLRDEYYSPGQVRLSNDEAEDLEKRLLNLSTRVGMLIDYVSAGYCNDSNYELDLDTARQSNGDWSIVKDKQGSPIKPSSHLHYVLFRYYLAGCNGEKDFAIARKILFDISDLAPDVNSTLSSELRSTIRHCHAEIWARYGIGGPTNEGRAREFSRRFTKEAWFPNSEDTPEARQRIASRPEYQHGVRDNFACPKLSRIDPRNPWQDLW